VVTTSRIELGLEVLRDLASAATIEEVGATVTGPTLDGGRGAAFTVGGRRVTWGGAGTKPEDNTAELKVDPGRRKHAGAE
jgi:hypothetical protein